jgi:acyl-coenzyme A synthetase/AMP-(fatty) acid ligase
MHEEIKHDNTKWVFLRKSPNSINQIFISKNLAPSEKPKIETDWVLYTSGTTGTPKAVRHSLHSLSKAIKQGSQKNTWGLIYEPCRMAGLQVILQALNSRESLFVPDSNMNFTDKIQEMVKNEVSALSATPTIWRNILQVKCSRKWNLRQVTLGGEIVNQSIINALKSRFPDARITHIFASTEAGAAFSVNDGLEGFPANFLDNGPNGMKIEIRNGNHRFYQFTKWSQNRKTYFCC